ncbi:MAG: hypothetical protein NC413_10935 [Muribaculum sp.]|nr:hypothetical protein [Muribaculum sp.]
MRQLGEAAMQMYEVVVLSEDMRTEIQRKVLAAEDEDEALDQMQELLEAQGIAYGICQAAEIG